MRLHELFEMAVPSPEMRARRYFHGTKFQKDAEAIMREGLKPGWIEQGRGKLAPVAGRVYVTPSIEYATIYALGGSMLGHKISDGFLARYGPYGYVFEISGDDLGDIHPDEDSIGEFVTKHTEIVYDKSNPKRWQFLGYEFKGDGVDDTEKYAVWRRLSRLMTPKQWRGSIEGEIDAQASGGKRALKSLTDAEKLALIRWGAHIANDGAIMPIACWRIERARSQELKPDGSNFFEIAEAVPLR